MNLRKLLFGVFMMTLFSFSHLNAQPTGATNTSIIYIFNNELDLLSYTPDTSSNQIRFAAVTDEDLLYYFDGAKWVDVSNKNQNLSFSNDSLYLTDGDAVYLGNYENTDTQLTEAQVDNFVSDNGYLTTEVDGSVTNELQDLTLVGDNLSLTDSDTDIDLSGYENTDNQNLTLTGNELSIENGNTIPLPVDGDGSSTNELQTLTRIGNTAILSNGGSISIIDGDSNPNNEVQTLTFDSPKLGLTRTGATVDLSVINTDTQLTEAQVDNFVSDNGYLTTEVDGSVTNELQDLTLVGDNLSLTDSDTDIDLSGYENTDNQNLTLTGNELSIENGNTIPLPVDGDGSSTNELQTLTRIGNTAILSNGGSISIIDGDSNPNNEVQTLTFDSPKLGLTRTGATVDLSVINTDTQLTEAQVDNFVSDNGYLTTEVDGSVTNELQDLTLVGDNLSLTDSDTDIDLSGYENTDNQNLTLTGNELSIENGNTIPLPNNADNLGDHTATQNIKLDGNYLSNDGGDEGINIDNGGRTKITTSGNSTSTSPDLTFEGNNATIAFRERDNPETSYFLHNNNEGFYLLMDDEDDPKWDGQHPMYLQPDRDMAFFGDLLFIRDANNRIGVRTGAPLFNFDINGTLRARGEARFQGTNYSSHFNYGTTQHTYIRGGKTASAIYINDVVSGNVLIAKGGGKVGLGKNNPVFDVDVEGTLATDVLRVENNAAAGKILKSAGAGGTLIYSDDDVLTEAQVDAFTDNNGYLDNTDEQDLILTGTVLSIENGAGSIDLSTTGGDNLGNHIAGANIQLNGFLLNGDGGAGEGLQAHNNGQIEIKNSSATIDFEVLGKSRLTTTQIDVPTAGAGYVLKSSDGAGNVYFDPLNDDDATNEFQNLTLSSNTLSLTNSATNISLNPYLDNTDEQDLSLVGSFLNITDGTSVNLNAFYDNTDEQDLSISGQTLSISGGNSVNLPSGDDDQTLSFNGGTDVLSISGGNSVTIGDDFGDHEAEQNIDLGNYYLSGDGGNEGLKVSSLGDVNIFTRSGGGTQGVNISNLSTGKSLLTLSNVSNQSALTVATGANQLKLQTTTTSASIQGNGGTDIISIDADANPSLEIDGIDIVFPEYDDARANDLIINNVAHFDTDGTLLKSPLSFAVKYPVNITGWAYDEAKTSVDSGDKILSAVYVVPSHLSGKKIKEMTAGWANVTTTIDADVQIKKKSGGVISDVNSSLFNVTSGGNHETKFSAAGIDVFSGDLLWFEMSSDSATLPATVEGLTVTVVID